MTRNAPPADAPGSREHPLPTAAGPHGTERDIYEVANQLAGFIDEGTPEKLARFLRREADAATKLADRIRALEAENQGLARDLATIADYAWNEEVVDEPHESADAARLAAIRNHLVVSEPNRHRPFAEDEGPSVVGADPAHGWVCYNEGPCEIFWSPEKEALEHELSSDIRPATAYEKFFFEQFGKSCAGNTYSIPPEPRDEPEAWLCRKKDDPRHLLIANPGDGATTVWSAAFPVYAGPGRALELAGIAKRAAQDYCYQRYKGRSPLNLKAPSVFTSHEWQRIGEAIDAALAESKTSARSH